jgi:hypothetical protein
MAKTMKELRAELERKRLAEKIGMRPDEDRQLQMHATARLAIHEGQASHPPLSDGGEEIGLAGEIAFARWAEVEPDLTLRPMGSGSVNFKINGKKINVSTARTPTYLIVERHKAKADVYVLYAYREQTRDARAIGWASKDEVQKASIRDAGGMGIKSYTIPHQLLHPMPELREVLEIGPRPQRLFE